MNCRLPSQFCQKIRKPVCLRCQPVTFLFFNIILEVYPINLSSEAAQGILVKKSVEAPVGCAVHLVLREDLCDLTDLRESLGACALGQGTATDVIPSN